MRSITCLIPAVVLSASLGTSVSAQPVAGVGALTCEEMRSRLANEPAALSVAYFSWAQGFLTGINEGRLANGATLVDLADATGQWSWLLSHCEQNPLVEVREAALALVLELMRRQGIE